MLRLIYRDQRHDFYAAMLKNQMQCFYWESFDKMKTLFGQNRQKTRRQNEIFREFMGLVKTHCRTTRDVNFYADKLCISPRYLSSVCTKNTTNKSAKHIIDQFAVLELKVLLETTQLSIQQIAELMNFPDQSYLGRFFKRYTGHSPLAYRFRKNERSHSGTPEAAPV